MKVKITNGGFYYDFGARETGEEIDLPQAVAKNWIENGLAEPAETKPKKSRQKTGPTEATADARAETKETR